MTFGHKAIVLLVIAVVCILALPAIGAMIWVGTGMCDFDCGQVPVILGGLVFVAIAAGAVAGFIWLMRPPRP